jgi:hypothetical protein
MDNQRKTRRQFEKYWGKAMKNQGRKKQKIFQRIKDFFFPRYLTLQTATGKTIRLKNPEIQSIGPINVPVPKESDNFPLEITVNMEYEEKS